MRTRHWGTILSQKPREDEFVPTEEHAPSQDSTRDGHVCAGSTDRGKWLRHRIYQGSLEVHQGPLHLSQGWSHKTKCWQPRSRSSSTLNCRNSLHSLSSMRAQWRICTGRMLTMPRGKSVAGFMTSKSAVSSPYSYQLNSEE